MTLTKTQAMQRMRKLEAEILPPPPVPTAILHQPSPDASAADLEAFERGLAAARQARAKVWVVTGAPVLEADPIADVIHVQHDWQAWLGLVGLQPGAVQDLRERLSGNIARPDPVATLPDDDEIDGERGTRRVEMLRGAMQWRERMRS